MPAVLRYATAALYTLLALTMTACQRDALPEPAYGISRCARCDAVIADAGFAAQFRRADGLVQSFDDPACLFAALRAEPSLPPDIRFRDHNNARWVGPADVWFARTAATAAHGSGWAAYASFSAAQEAVTAGGSGEILPFDRAKDQLGREPGNAP